MNKINNQFTSIEQITDRYLGTGKGNACRCRNLLIFVLLRTKRTVAKMCENLRILS